MQITIEVPNRFIAFINIINQFQYLVLYIIYMQVLNKLFLVSCTNLLRK